MKYKVFIFCPDDPKIIDACIDAAASAGAGVFGNYHHTAFITKGTGQWFSGVGTHPTIGKIGELTRQNEVKIEMVCDESIKKQIFDAIKKVHPYEEPSTEFVKIEDSN